MKFKRLNEEYDLVEYFDYIVSELGEEKAYIEIKKNLPFMLKTIFVVMPIVRSFVKKREFQPHELLGAIRDTVEKCKVDRKMWIEVLGTTARKNGLNGYGRLGESLSEAFNADNIEKMWDFLVDRIDQKQLVRVFISACELQMPEMVTFLEEIYERTTPREFLDLIREVIHAEPDEMGITVCWIAKKFKLDKEAAEFAEENGL